MRFKNILLVQARYDTEFSNVLPAGIGYLSEFLIKHGIENEVFDLNLKEDTPEKLFKAVKELKPDLVGFSMMSLNYKYNYTVINILKERVPEVKIVVGGPHISTVREQVLKECPGVDYGVALEGEFTLLELMEGKRPVEEIEGLLRRTDGGKSIAFNGERPFIRDLDAIPFPRYTKFAKKRYAPLLSILTSRGCPFQCIYCPIQLAIGRRFIPRSPASIVAEVEYHYSNGYREFSFRDDNFTLIPERVFRLCDELEKKDLKDIYLMCDNGVRADTLSYELLERMYRVGFRMIGLGAESGSDKILKILKKGQDLAATERVLKWAAELNYKVELYFLIGAPGETWDDFVKSVELVERHPIMKASFYQLLPYPNTELFDMVSRSGQLLRPPEEYLNDGSQRRNTPFFWTEEMPREDRVRAFDYANARLKCHLKEVNKKFYRENAREKFRRFGLNDTLAGAMSAVYCSDFLHDYIFNNRISQLVKTGIRKGFFSRRMRDK
ncbi:B12-binding domain-containing radical SAM protein [Candidatus Omnitrophota bacterium]